MYQSEREPDTSEQEPELEGGERGRTSVTGAAASDEMRRPPPFPAAAAAAFLPPITAFLSASLHLLSLFAALSLLLLLLLPSRRLRPINDLSPVRLLLIISASLAVLPGLLLLAEPCFLATLLVLLRSTTLLSPPPFLSSLAFSLLPSLPFLLLTLLCHRYTFNFALCSTVMLAALAAVYIPLFVSAAWGAVSVVINKQLRGRVYVLVATVVAAISVQVAALAFSWVVSEGLAQVLGFLAFLALVVCAAVAEVVLVVRPFFDALAVCKDSVGVGVGVGADQEERGACMVGVDGGR